MAAKNNFLILRNNANLCLIGKKTTGSILFIYLFVYLFIYLFIYFIFYFFIFLFFYFFFASKEAYPIVRKLEKKKKKTR